jgi:hypothetical protein
MGETGASDKTSSKRPAQIPETSVCQTSELDHSIKPRYEKSRNHYHNVIEGGYCGDIAQNVALINVSELGIS